MPPIPPLAGTQPLTDEQQAQAALDAITQQIQGLGGQAPEPMGPPGFLERLFQSGAGEQTFQPMGFFQGALQGLAGGLASRGQKVAQKRQQIEALIEQQRQAKAQQTLKDLESKRAAAQTELGQIQSETRAGKRKKEEFAQENPIVTEADVKAGVAPPFMLGQPAPLAWRKGAGPEEPGLALTPQGLDAAAKMYARTGMLPPMGIGKQTAGVRTKIINRAAEIFPDLDIATNKAGFQSTAAALTNLKKINSAAQAFAETAKKNSNVLRGTLKNAIDTGAPWLNRPIRALAKATGDPNIQAFRTAIKTVNPEYARLLNSPSASGQLSDTARAEIETILSEDSTPAQILASLDVLDQDANNRTSSYASQIKQLEFELAHPGKQMPIELPTTTEAATLKYDPSTGTYVPIGP